MARPPLPLGTYGKIKTWQESGAWLARAQFRDFDGAVRPVKRSGKTKAAAIRKLKAALAERQRPVKHAEITPHTTMEKLATLWLTEIEAAVDAGTKSPGTLDAYRSIYRRHVKPALGDIRVQELDTPVVDRFLEATKKTTISGARTAKIVVSGMMRLAARHGAVAMNPVREVGRIEATPRPAPRSLTSEQRQQWLDAVQTSETAQVWDLPDLSLMMLATGCRIGECLAIGWEEVDLDRASVDVRWRLIRRTGVGLLRLPSTKTGERGERLIPLPSWAITMLKKRRLAIASGVQPVFPDSLGGWRDPSNVRRVWRKVRDDAGIEGLVSHTLRKTVASFLDDAAVPTRKISDQLGHTRISMTQDHYIGRKLTDRQTAEVLEKLLRPGGA
jgi:integrase